MLNYEDNIRAILQTVFSETKESNIDVAVDNILNLKCEDAPVKKDDTPTYYLSIELERVDRKNVKKLIECHGISEVAAYNLIKLYATIVASLEIKLEQEDK